jgi:hypothetical protein
VQPATIEVRKSDNKIISSNFIINLDLRNREMSISFNQLNGTDVSDGRGNTTLGTLSSQGADGQRGLNNTAVGFGALRTNGSSVQHNTAIGLNALSNNAGSDNVAIGENALYNYLTPTVAQTGNYNVAVGNNAIQYNTIGYQNVALGNQALNNNTTGYLNVAIGNNAMEGTGTTNETGSYNVAIGNQALNNNISGSDNAVVGNAAGYFNTTGKNNAALGANALLNNTTGTQNVAIGKDALKSAQVAIGNVAVGHHALKNNATGNGNIGIGNHALTASTTGSNNVGIGSGVSSNGKDSCILLGNNAQTVASNEIGIGGINLATPPSPAPSITGYLPVRMSNSTLSNKLYYVPMYDPSVPLTLPIPEVIIANSSSAGVGLLIGFPSGYSAATSVTIVNGACTVVINSPSTSGYYVYYERANTGGFWDSLSPSTFSNLVSVSGPTPQSDSPTLCGGLVFGNTLTFTYVLAATPTTVTYQPTPPSQLNITDGYQYQQYNGASATTSNGGFQWGRNPDGGGSQSWGTQTGSGTQTYAQWQAVASDYQYNSIYKYLYPYSTVSGPGPGPSASMTWPVTKSLLSIANGATYTIGGTDIPAPTIAGVTGAAPTITYSISCDSNMPSITLSGSTLTVVWDNAWSTSVSTGLSTNAYIIATVQGTPMSAYLTTVLTVGSSNTLTWEFSQYTQLTAPTLYTIPAALAFSAQPPYYTNTPAFTVTNAYTNVAITSTGASSAVTSNGVTTITPQTTAGSTIITATSSTGKTRTLLTIAAPPSSGVTLLYSQVANMVLSSNLSISPSASQQFIANQQGTGTDEVSGIIDYFLMPLITFINVPHTSNISFEMTLAKNGTTLVTTTFTLPGDTGTIKYLHGINIPFISPSAASNNPSINFTISPTSANTTITNLDQITISLKPLSIIQMGNWQINVVGSEMAGKVYGISQSPIIRTVPTFTPALLTFADVVYTSGLMIPFTLVSNSSGTITHTISPSDVGTITNIVNSGSGPTSYRVNVSKPGTATITFTQAASGSFSGKIVTATLKVLATPTITFTSVVNSVMTSAIDGKTVALNDAAISTNTNAAITYTLTGVSNIAGTTNPCATITTTGSNQTLNLLGFGSITLVASQLSTPQTVPPYGPGTNSLAITVVPGDGPSNRIVLNTIASNSSTTPFVLDLFVNSANVASMSYKTPLNAVVTYFNIPRFNVKIDNGSNTTVYFTLTVYRGPAGSVPSIPVSTTYFNINTDAFGNYNPTGGITVPLSPPVSSGSPGYMPITPGLTVVSTSNAGQLQLYAIQTPLTPYSISTETPSIMIVLSPSTNAANSSVTVDVNTNNPSGMLGTLYGYIQLLSPNLAFAPIITPITWTAGQIVSFTQASSNAIDLMNITYSSSTPNVATIPTSTVSSMTLATNQPTTPTNIITISATRAATATYSQQTVSMNPNSTTNPSTPQYPICIKTYALTSLQKMAFTNPINNQMGNNAPGASVMITFIASESFQSFDSLNFAINGGQYGYTQQQPSGTSQSFQITLSINNTVKTTISFTTNVLSYNSNDNGTLREIPFAPLENYPTYIQSFSCTGPTPTPSCYIGDKIEITMSCNVGWFIKMDSQSRIATTIVGTSLIPPSSPLLPVPKILYMTSSDSTLTITTTVNSNVYNIFKRAVITSFQITGVNTQIQVQNFTVTAQQTFGNLYFQIIITFTYDFGSNYANAFASINVPFSYTEYARLYPTSTPMTAFSINVSTNTGASQGVPTPFLCNISDQFSITFQPAIGSPLVVVNALGNMMSGSVYGYEIQSNPELRNFNTLKTPLNYISTNYMKTIPPPSTNTANPTFTYSVVSNNNNNNVAIGTGANANKLVLSSGYCNATVSVVQSETNQYFASSISQNVDVISRKLLPPNTYSMTTTPAATFQSFQTVYQYVNVISHTNGPIPLYGYGFFDIGSSDNNCYSSPGGSQYVKFSFKISKYNAGVWNLVRTIDVSYHAASVNSNDDGSLFIIPFYNTFSNIAPTNLPFKNMPTNISSFIVTPNNPSDDPNSPPSFNLGDMLQFNLYVSSVNNSVSFPTTNNNQLAGTVLSSYAVSPVYAGTVNQSSYNSRNWVSTTMPTGQRTFNSVPYTPTNNIMYLGIKLYPMTNLPQGTTFTIVVYMGAPYMTIQGVTNVANAFNNETPIWFTMTPFAIPSYGYPDNISITDIRIDDSVSRAWINSGQPVSTNPVVASGNNVSISFNLTLSNTPHTALYYIDQGNNIIQNIPGVFYGISL